MLRRFIENGRERNERLLIVGQTAAHPWCERVCDLLNIDADRLSLSPPLDPRYHTVESSSLDRDGLAILFADRVDVAYVRRGGTVLRWLHERLEADDVANVHVAVTPGNQAVAQDLIRRGAIGYWMPLEEPLESAGRSRSAIRCDDAARRSLFDEPDRWLIHSTRARTGPWPGQSTQQFHDWLLLSPPEMTSSSPLETLAEIVRQRRLIGTHQTIRSTSSVVSFSSLPIDHWLARRCYRPQLGRWDAEPYGIAIDRTAAISHGIQSVIYGCDGVFDSLADDEQWRYQAGGKTFDWTQEQEWRANGVVDLAKFGQYAAIVFVKSADEAGRIADCPWPIVAVQ